MAQVIFAAYDWHQSPGKVLKDEITGLGHTVLAATGPQELAELIQNQRPDGVVIFSLGADHFIQVVPKDLGLPVLYFYTVERPAARPGLVAAQLPGQLDALKKLEQFLNEL